MYGLISYPVLSNVSLDIRRQLKPDKCETSEEQEMDRLHDMKLISNTEVYFIDDFVCPIPANLPPGM